MSFSHRHNIHKYGPHLEQITKASDIMDASSEVPSLAFVERSRPPFLMARTSYELSCNQHSISVLLCILNLQSSILGLFEWKIRSCTRFSSISKVVWPRLRTNLIRILHLAFANTTKPLKFPLESLLLGLRFLVPQKKRQMPI